MSVALKPARPFLKWAGGKTGLLSQYGPLFFPESRFNTYYEPFLGGGAVFFWLHSQGRFVNAVLSDVNPELINCYVQVRDNVHQLIGFLEELERWHKDEREKIYKRFVAQDPATLSPLGRAGRFIFLNKTAYNGLYRENKSGQFNVPYGKYANPTICDEENLLAASHALRHVEILCTGYENVIPNMIKRLPFLSLTGVLRDYTWMADNLVYFDPPYHPISETSSFASYTRWPFGSAEQVELRTEIERLTEYQVPVLMSNSKCRLTEVLYRRKPFHITEIEARRSINSAGDKRGKIKELLIWNGVEPYPTQAMTALPVIPLTF